MPDITQQRMGEILRRVFELLWFEPEGLPVRDIFKYVLKSSQLSEYERGYFPFASSSPRYEVLLRVATIPLVKAGWLVKTTRGRWYITDKGRKASQQYGDAEQFFEEAISQYREWKENEEKRLRYINSIEKYEAQENSWVQIKQFIQGMSASEFKNLTVELLQSMGYYMAWVAPPQKEKGQIDIIAFSDPLGTKNPRVVVHVNHKGQVMTQEGLGAVLAILGPEDHGVLFSSSGFTNQVKEEALTLVHPSIHLIDLESFVDLWVKYYDKLSEEARHSFPLKAVYFLSMPD
jgi:restriction system protein